MLKKSSIKEEKKYTNIVKTKRILFFASFVLLILLTAQVQQIKAYTSSGGIEDGDEVILDYVLYVDNKEYQKGNDFDTVVKKGTLIDGFYEGLLGMKIGEEKRIVVPPDKGYTNPSDELYGKELVFDVYFKELVHNVRDDTSSTSSGTGLGNALTTIGEIITGIAIIAFLGYIYIQSRSRIKNPYCEHCLEHNIKTRSDGHCSKCGKYYCRASFAKGCPNCGNNTLIPNK